MAQTGRARRRASIEVELIRIRGKIGKARGICKVRGETRQ